MMMRYFLFLKTWLWERGDTGIEEVSTEIRNQGARNDALSRPDCAPDRLPGRPVVYERAQEVSGRPPGRPTEMA